MSDTPRTDEQINGKPCTRFEVIAGDSLRNASVPSEFARGLERELNAANSRIELLMSANADVARIAGERDAAEKRVNRLEAVVNDPHALWANWLRGDVKLPAGIGDVRQYQKRIKQLEEAVEAYRTAYTPDGHVSPHDCFATGPKTGNPFQDLFACPGCLAERKAKEAKP